jgi:tripeptide aminopeptidase
MSTRIERARVVEDLLSLCRIYGPSGQEYEVASFIVDRAVSLGLACSSFPEHTIPNSGTTPCLLLSIPGSSEGEVVLLSAHMDTVPVGSTDGAHLVREEGVLKTDGTTILGGDDRAGIAAALEMARIASEHPELHAGIEILFTVQEELGCRGMAGISVDELRAVYGFNLDGETPPGSAIRQAPRKMKYTCRVTGRSSHAALEPEEGINAIRAAAMIITHLPQGQVDEQSTANIGSITGGGQTNVVPDFVSFTGEIRSFSTAGCEELQKQITDVCIYQAHQIGATAVVDWELLYDGYIVESDAPSIRRFLDACRKLGVSPRLLRSPGGGDSNTLNSRGIESIVFGLGMHHIHTFDEYLVLDEYLQAVTLLYHSLFR